MTEEETITDNSGETDIILNRILKSVDDGKFVIAGYASPELRDKDGNILPDIEGDSVNLDALDKAFNTMMVRESRRNHMVDHTNMQIGELLFDYTDSEGVVWKSHVERVIRVFCSALVYVDFSSA